MAENDSEKTSSKKGASDGLLGRLRIRKDAALGAPVSFETKLKRVRRLLNLVLVLAVGMLIGVLIVPFPETYEAQGVVRPRNVLRLLAAAEVEQRESAVLVREGERVTKGQELMRFHLPQRRADILATQAALDSARAALKVQQAKTAASEKMPLPKELWEMNEQLAQSESSRDYYKAELDRAKELAESGDVSVQEVDRAQLLYEQAVIEHARLKQRLDIVEAGYSEALLEEARAEEARIRQEVANAEARLALLEEEFARLSVLRSPADGVILDMPQKNVLGMVAKGRELVHMGIGTERIVRMFGLQRDFNKVEVGQRVRYKSKVYDALKVDYAEGTIYRISQTRQRDASGEAGDERERYYAILGDIDKEPKPLQLDSNVTAKIVLRKRPIAQLLFGVN